MIVGRFAPSPTGLLHYGSLVACLGSWLFARKACGSWLLRIDDLDQPRVVKGALDDILRTLEALGFEWDGVPIRQSRRDEAYRKGLARLEDLGLIYPCGCSRSEIVAIASAPHGAGDEVVYPGICRSGLTAGKQPRALRIRVPDEDVGFVDGIQGRYLHRLSSVCGDFIVRRADGLFAYHLATVIDDADCGVNQVVRGSDLLFSTPRQIYLQSVLGLNQPDYFHLPLVTADDGSKLSKRDSAVSLSGSVDLKKEGAASLIAALQFLGQPVDRLSAAMLPSEILSIALLRFDPGLIPAKGAGFPKMEIA